MSNNLLGSWKRVLADTKNLKVGWIVTAGVLALYIGVVRPNEMRVGINNSKATGLAAQTRPVAFWRQARLSSGLYARQRIRPKSMRTKYKLQDS